jgi:hypothetical protein
MFVKQLPIIIFTRLRREIYYSYAEPKNLSNIWAVRANIISLRHKIFLQFSSSKKSLITLLFSEQVSFRTMESTFTTSQYTNDVVELLIFFAYHTLTFTFSSKPWIFVYKSRIKKKRSFPGLETAAEPSRRRTWHPASSSHPFLSVQQDFDEKMPLQTIYFVKVHHHHQQSYCSYISGR